MPQISWLALRTFSTLNPGVSNHRCELMFGLILWWLAWVYGVVLWMFFQAAVILMQGYFSPAFFLPGGVRVDLHSYIAYQVLIQLFSRS